MCARKQLASQYVIERYLGMEKTRRRKQLIGKLSMRFYTDDSQCPKARGQRTTAGRLFKNAYRDTLKANRSLVVALYAASPSHLQKAATVMSHRPYLSVTTWATSRHAVQVILDSLAGIDVVQSRQTGFLKPRLELLVAQMPAYHVFPDLVLEKTCPRLLACPARKYGVEQLWLSLSFEFLNTSRR